MNTFRKLCAAVVLTLIMALSTFAGEIQIPLTSPPPSSVPMQEASLSLTTEFGLELLRNALALL